MTKATLFEARLQEVEYGSHSKDAKRNYLGFIYKKNQDGFIKTLDEACKEHGESIRVYSKYHHDTRLAFSYTPLIAEIIELSKKAIGEVGLLFEEPITGYDGTQSIKDTERLMVFIYFNINHKSLTRFRNFLLNNVIEVQKETV